MSAKHPQLILLHVNLFTETGKWKYGFEVEVSYDPGGGEHDRLLAEIDMLQREVVKGTVISGGYHVVITDDPEHKRNPTGSFFMNRLYTCEQVRRLFPPNIARSVLEAHSER